MKLTVLKLAIAVGVVMGLNGAALAQDAIDPKLAARLAAEKEARKACKAEICKVFAEGKGTGSIGCDVTKTWLHDEIQSRILGDRLSWPWGHAQCKARIELDKAELVKLVSSPEATIKLKKHDIACSLDSKDAAAGEAYAVKMSIAPQVSFSGGKATKVVVDWGNIDAPTLAKGPLWAATATDNTFNVLSSSMVREINDFMFTKCADEGIKVAQPQQ